MLSMQVNIVDAGASGKTTFSLTQPKVNNIFVVYRKSKFGEISKPNEGLDLVSNTSKLMSQFLGNKKQSFCTSQFEMLKTPKIGRFL